MQSACCMQSVHCTQSMQRKVIDCDYLALEVQRPYVSADKSCIILATSMIQTVEQHRAVFVFIKWNGLWIYVNLTAIKVCLNVNRVTSAWIKKSDGDGSSERSGVIHVHWPGLSGLQAGRAWYGEYLQWRALPERLIEPEKVADGLAWKDYLDMYI